ncbi:two-component system sensor histidine kinase CreC [Neisseria sp. HSC-16F19]|nr:two-component system sensor histidine kinase CreC [Neisseria sp. HSC-16F19]MCP2039953.1 two-component system sensor histidine kinase CreC [Neisseria sp. HSC-16F19]
MKISFGLRFVAVFLALAAVLSWLFVNQALDHIKVSLRQSAETTLVDMAQILAAGLEDDIGEDGQVNTQAFARRFQAALDKEFQADVYQLQKRHIDLHVYVTDGEGVVLYDSRGRHTGAYYGRWQDVYRTLRGEYGARTSFIDPAHTAEGDPKQLVVAAPIRHQGRIVGVVSLAQPTHPFDIFRLAGAQELRYAVGAGVLLSLVIIVLMSWWLTHALGRLSRYAEAMAANRKATKPRFYDPHFARLGDAIEHLRQELDGKQHVEQYIHGLTHELKTPMTGIQAAGEFLQEDDLSPADQQQLVARILAANRRMQDLVAHMLSLAKLENQQELAQREVVALDEVAANALELYRAEAEARAIRIGGLPLPHTPVMGDALLLEQAVSNLMANALAFCPDGGDIRISLIRERQQVVLQLFNSGEPIPDYALPRLYERFFSLPRPHGGARSSGLGLSFVAQIMALHGGSVRLYNDTGGVTAELRLNAA